MVLALGDRLTKALGRIPLLEEYCPGGFFIHIQKIESPTVQNCVNTTSGSGKILCSNIWNGTCTYSFLIQMEDKENALPTSSLNANYTKNKDNYEREQINLLPFPSGTHVKCKQHRSRFFQPILHVEAGLNPQ